MNRVAIRRRDGREERIMYSVDEGIMGKAGGSPRNTAHHKKGDTAAATMTMMMMTQKKERKNVGRKTTDKIASSNADGAADAAKTAHT